MRSMQLSPIFVLPFSFPITPLRLPPRPASRFQPILFPLPLPPLRSIHRALRIPSAIGPDGKFHPSAPSPSDDEPPEAPEDSLSQQFERQLSRGRKAEEKEEALLLAALALEEDPPDIPDARQESSGDDLLGNIDRAIAQTRKEFVDKGLLKPNPPKKNGKDLPVKDVDNLTPEEVMDLNEINELQGLTVVSEDEAMEEEGGLKGKQNSDEISGSKDSGFPSFDLDLDNFGRLGMQLLEPRYQMTLAELMDESRVVPLSVYGDLEVPITGIQHDSREVTAGDLFVCCVDTESHLYLSEAGKRGAVAVVATKEINIDETLGCKALVIVEDTKAVLATLAASFYRHPSKSMSVIGITGTTGKTTTAHLIKGLYETMAVKTGMLTTVGYILQGNYQADIPESTDAVIVQKLMAKMVHNGTEAMVMEATAPGFAPGMSDEIDFDIAVFTNFDAVENGFHGSKEEYISSQVKLFERMVDPERHRKVVNIDDPNAPLLVGLGNTGVPIITYAMDNKNADVYALKYELSLFETLVLVNTPDGILEISSGLLGRNNIYNILAAVAVGVAVGAPLENIVRGIEEVDAVPGRCELIDEEQAFGVIVDHARTPDALSRLLDGVRELGPRRIITVFGCCGEKERGKRPLMTKIAADKSDVVLLTSDNPRKEEPMDILDDMLSGVGWSMQDYLKYGENDYYPPLPNGHRLFLHDIRRVAVRAAVAMGEEGDVVVVAGKGHETYQIEGDKNEFFDDREECRDALHYVDELHHAGIDTSEFPWRFPDSH